MKHKKSAVFFLAFFLCSAVLQAEIGAKAGGLFSLAGDNSAVYNASNKIGLRAGIFWSFGLGPVSIRSGVDLARKGARSYSAKIRAYRPVDLDYASVPLLLNIHLPSTPVDVFGGVYAGILIRSADRDPDDWTWEGNKVKRYDYGIFLRRYSLNTGWRRLFILPTPRKIACIETAPFPC